MPFGASFIYHPPVNEDRTLQDIQNEFDLWCKRAATTRCMTYFDDTLQDLYHFQVDKAQVCLFELELARIMIQESLL